MPKSQVQKRQEAIERARAYLPKHRQNWMDWQPGGELYEKTAKADKAYAEKLREAADKRFDQAAERAHTDRHGNPLP